jgi:hypothetical protein
MLSLEEPFTLDSDNILLIGLRAESVSGGEGEKFGKGWLSVLGLTAESGIGEPMESSVEGNLNEGCIMPGDFRAAEVTRLLLVVLLWRVGVEASSLDSAIIGGEGPSPTLGDCCVLDMPDPVPTSHVSLRTHHHSEHLTYIGAHTPSSWYLQTRCPAVRHARLPCSFGWRPALLSATSSSIGAHGYDG